jgi:hypothetical protein
MRNISLEISNRGEQSRTGGGKDEDYITFHKTRDNRDKICI